MLTNPCRPWQARASVGVGLLVLVGSAASCSSPSDAPKRAERSAAVSDKLRFQLDNADGVAVANQNLLIVLQGKPDELSDAAGLPDHVEVSWIGDLGTATRGVHSDTAPKLDLRLTAPGRPGWIPTRVLEVESDELGEVELDVGPEFAGRKLTLGVCAAFEECPIHWIGAIEPDAASGELRLVRLETLDRLERPPDPETLDDARLALETQIECWNWLRTRRSVGFSQVALIAECGRRGGSRWSAFLEAREQELLRNLADPPLHGLWLPIQSALRRTRGEAPPLRVVVHPDDQGTRPRNANLPIRFAIENVDPVHAYDLSFVRSDALVVVEDAAGRPRGRKRFPDFPHVGLASHSRVAAGESTTTHDAEGWWSIDVTDEFELGEGDWTVRLVYSPLFGCTYAGFVPGSPTFTSDPFLVRIHGK